MSQAQHRRPPKQVQSERKPGELKYTFVIAPPDGELDADGNPIPVQLEVELRAFKLAERDLVKRALSKFTEPDMTDVCVVHAWVVWRRTHPTSSLQHWMDNITMGQVIDAISLEPGHVAWDTTPEGYDPNP